MKWMDICARKSKKIQRCELCHYQYTRQKRFKFTEWKLPRCSRRDKMLHIIFLVNLIVMICCAVATVYCFLSDQGIPHRARIHTGHRLHERRNEDVSYTPVIVVTARGDSANREEDGHSQVDLTSEEVATLCCGVLFFVSFFVAMYAQIKAKHTLYQLFTRFASLNTNWEIEEYDPCKDPLLTSGNRRFDKNVNDYPVLV